MNAKRVLAGLVTAALLVCTAAPALADEAVMQADGETVVTDGTYVEQDGISAEQAEVYVEQDPAELLTTEPEMVIINDGALSGESVEEYEPEELIIVDEGAPETALEETETATEAETESAAEERFAVLLPKTEGGEVIFAESETLPPAEENEDESIRERRSFAEGEKVEIMVRAVSEEYRLAGIKVVSAEDADREYPLKTTEQGYAFLMPAEPVKVLAVFEEIQMSESGADAVAEQEAEAVTEQSGADVPEAVTEQSAADAPETEAVSELPAVEEQQKAGSSLPAGADDNKKKDTIDKKTKSSGQSVQEKKKEEKKEEAEEADADKDLLGAAVKSVKLNKKSLTIVKGKTATLKATVSPSNASNKGVTWKSSNKSVATVSSKGVVTAKKAGTATITVTTKSGNKKATCKVTVKNPSSAVTQKKPSVSYQTHVQTIGWQDWKKDGAMAGTQGKSKRLEGIYIKLSNLPYSGGVQYRTHVQTYGWEKSWRSNGAMSGTQGQAKRLEAIEIRLTGQMAKKYDIYYRVHAQHFGWMGWAKNGERSGTAGYAYRLEGIQIVLVKKGAGAPSANFGGQSQWTSTKFSEKKFDSSYFKNKMAEAANYYTNWYLTHGDAQTGLISKADVTYRTIQGGQSWPFYAVTANGIHSLSDLRKQSHRYYTNACIRNMENTLNVPFCIERNNKLYLSKPSGLGSASYVKSMNIQVTKESSSAYSLRITMGVQYAARSTTETVNLRYVKEGSDWCFDRAVAWYPYGAYRSNVTCTVR